MSNGYTKNHTIEDVLSNEDFRDLLPQYKVNSNGKNIHIINDRIITSIFKIAKSSASGHYNPFNPSFTENEIIISGVVDDLDSAFNDVYNGISANKLGLTINATYKDFFKEALAQSEILGKYGNKPKLYLKEGMYRNIKNITEEAKIQFVEDLINNIKYSNQFVDVQRRFEINKETDYIKNKIKWQNEVGEPL